MIPVAEPVVGDREAELVLEAVESGWVSPGGDFVDRFETEFANFVGTDHALATSTGTSALHLSLVAAGVGRSDEVLVPSLTWIACANTVRYVGAEPVFVDIDPRTYTMDPESAREAITEDTVAMMPVHLYGHPCDMSPLLDLAIEHDLMVIEDCAEAHGAEYTGESVGSIGDFGCFSFYGNKILTTGQGGMITTDDDELAERIELYRRDGMSDDRKYYHEVVGYNYRLTNLQAALGVAQLERADHILERKREIAAEYRRRLSDLPVRVSPAAEWATPVFWMNTIEFTDTVTKDEVVNILSESDVETRPFFYPLHMQPPYAEQVNRALPAVSDVYDRSINVPSSPTLGDEISEICRLIAGAF